MFLRGVEASAFAVFGLSMLHFCEVHIVSVAFPLLEPGVVLMKWLFRSWEKELMARKKNGSQLLYWKASGESAVNGSWRFSGPRDYWSEEKDRYATDEVNEAAVVIVDLFD